MKIVTFFTLIVFPSISIAQFSQSLNGLINAEKAFAATSETKSTKIAFLENLSDDAILFKRGIVNGKKFWQDAPEGNDKLTWEPQYADISAGGDFGYTTGPYKQYQNRSDANPAGGGHYLSVWQKQNGTWKVVYDGGVGHPPVDVSTWEKQSAVPTSKSKNTIEQDKADISKLENSFQEDFRQKGALAFTNYLSAEARIYRPRKAPYRKNNIPELLAETDKKFMYEAPIETRVASSGDMAFNYGNVAIEITVDGNTRQLKGNYLRIWKKENGSDWKIVFDMISL